MKIYKNCTEDSLFIAKYQDRIIELAQANECKCNDLVVHINDELTKVEVTCNALKQIKLDPLEITGWYKKSKSDKSI